MTTNLRKPVTLQQAIVYFSDACRTFRYAVELRWPDGKVTCPRCGSDSHSFIKTRRIWFCNGCKKQFTVKVGTIFEDSALGLDKWMAAVWTICNAKNGVSSYEISRSLGITQKSAWFMLHRIREAMKHESFRKLGSTGGPVGVDETFVGAHPKNMHARRRAKLNTAMRGWGDHETIVMGMLDRNAREVRAKVIPNVKRETLQDEVLRQVQGGGTVYTDGHYGYANLKAQQFIHETVNHLEECVRGEVHTQGMENFWSLLKRGLKGTYVAVEPFHLNRYVGEQVFRFNNRAMKDDPLNDADSFMLAMSQAAGKRLTCADLAGKGRGAA